MSGGRARDPVWVGLFLLLAGAGALAGLLGWPLRASLFPWVIAAPLVVLAALAVALDLARWRSAVGANRPGASGGGQPAGEPVEAEAGMASAGGGRRRLTGFLGWTAAFTAGLWLLGFPLAVPLFLFAYLRWAARERWTTAVSLAAAGWVFVYLVAYREIHLSMPEGLLWSWLP